MSGQTHDPDRIGGVRLRPIEERDGPFSSESYALDPDPQYGYEDWSPDWDYEPELIDRVRSAFGRGLIRIGWFVLAAGLALGSAGVIASQQQLAQSGDQPQLTYGADSKLADRLDQAVRGLALLNDDVQSLDKEIQDVFTGLAQVNRSNMEKAWNSGSNSISDVAVQSTLLESLLGCEAWTATSVDELAKSYSPGMIDRYDKACAALSSVAPLQSDWEGLVYDSQTAIEVATDLNSHDQYAGDALILANEAQYSAALDKLATATSYIDDAAAIAADKAKTIDVSTLQTLVARTKQMDDALEFLWQTMVTTGGQLNAAAEAALKNVNAAKALLADDTGAFQTAVQEMAMGLYRYRLSSQVAGGQLTIALDTLTGELVYGSK
jgi:hypothetical protein